MGIKISKSATENFINKLIEVHAPVMSTLKNDDNFIMNISNALTEFIKENYKEAARICLSHEHALNRITGRNMEIRTVIDVGSSNGRIAAWLREKFFKDAYLLCIEGFEVWREDLEMRKKRMNDFEYVISAAGDKTGKIYFYENKDKPTQGHAFHKKPELKYREIDQTTIDFEVENRGLQGPFMIKVDTHGREAEILIGAENTLRNTELLMIEVNNFEDRGRLRFHELCAFLEDRDFRCADIAEPTWRMKDNTFWQCDMFFLRKNRPEWTVKGF